RRYATVLNARDDGAPVLQLVDVSGRLVTEHLDRVLVAKIVRAFDRVESVLLGVVRGGVAERGVDPALSGARMAAHGMDLRDERHVRPLVVGLDSRAHAGTAGTDDQDIVLGLHQDRTLSDRGGGGAQTRAAEGA